MNSCSIPHKKYENKTKQNKTIKPLGLICATDHVFIPLKATWSNCVSGKFKNETLKINHWVNNRQLDSKIQSIHDGSWIVRSPGLALSIKRQGSKRPLPFDALKYTEFKGSISIISLLLQTFIFSLGINDVIWESKLSDTIFCFSLSSICLPKGGCSHIKTYGDVWLYWVPFSQEIPKHGSYFLQKYP